MLHLFFFFLANTVNTCPFCSLFSVMVFGFLSFLLVISLFKMAPKRSAEMLSGVPKRKKAVMCLTEKIRVLDKLRSGMSYSAVGREFNVNESTIRYIQKREEEIRRSVREAAPESAKVTSIVRAEAMEKMEKRLNLWIHEMTADKRSVVDSIVVRLKAKEIYGHVTQGQENVKPFSASAGWLARFKRRYGVKNVKLPGEAGSADQEAMEEFKKYLVSIIQEKGYVEEQVFNADETSLFYKDVGKRTYVTQMASKAPGFKSFKDRATLLLCANAKGDFKCKPLMVYRAQNPRALKGKNLNCMPVHWRWNRKAWMTSDIFWDWFHNCFIPEVKRYLQGKNFAFKVLLILDNAPAHCREELENAHPSVEVLFMPPSTASLIQPLDQGIIKAFKAYYMGELYGKACEALNANKEITMMEYWKAVTIRNVIDYAGTAWDSINQAIINNCWKNIWPDCVKNFEGFEGVTENIKNSVKNIMRLAWQISGEGFDDMKEDDVEEILAEKAVEPTNEDLDDMAKQGMRVSDVEDGDENWYKTPRIVPLTAAKISEWNSALEKICNDMEECDPILERSLKFKHLASSAFVPYAEMLKDLRRKARQTKLMQFFKPVLEGKSPMPSTSRESQTPEVELPDVCIPPSLISSSSAE
ncbi:tigger transposable element-derived protein 1 [Dasypus novemcinctus]|uniref:tigger transposable element-derived protein 1 n=1 Tax=Dasypus novemcinctus TaxID=9361 RepID=UPI000328BA78|nr:tigger transposable element-derived protein 1 [Dasypus novemcinctus]XP_012377846.1 tigger transposable element-derived protein 1 [Dasypus novemcinctus]XP_058159140.1 tigger transposable element-derived protein 1 [Dasypus novemcinctus]